MKSIYNHTITCLLFIVIVCLWITWLPYHVVFHLGPDAVNWIAGLYREAKGIYRDILEVVKE